MHYRDVDADGQPILPPESINLLERDVDAIIVPDVLPNAHQIAELIRTIQIVSNYARRERQRVLERYELWKTRRDRIQHAIGGADKLKATEAKRKELTKLATAAWGPVDPLDPTGAQGILNGLLPVELDTAAQLGEFFLTPSPESTGTPRTDYAYDDIVRMFEGYLARVDRLLDTLESRHFDLNNLTKLIVGESFGARQGS